MIDISDGLGIDLDRLATASGVGVVLDVVPTAEGATRDEALAGGEDYELVFAAVIWRRRKGFRGREIAAAYPHRCVRRGPDAAADRAELLAVSGGNTA